MFQEILFGIILLIFISFIIVNKRPKGYPPGPITYPIVGHFPYLGKYVGIGIHHLFTKWSKKYGPIISIDLAMHRAIVIKDPKLIKEAWNIPQLCGRKRFPITMIRSGTDGVQRGIIFNDGQNWIDQRRFILRHLRDFGFGKTAMENIIMNETHELIKTLYQNVGKPISTQALFNVAIINAIWTIVAGERFNHDDPKLAKLVACVTQNLSDTGSAGVILFMNWLCILFPDISGWNKYIESFYTTNNFIRNFIESRKISHNENNINDFIACYIENVNKTTDPISSFYGDEGIKNLLTDLDDLFSAGGETTSTTLTWLMLYLAMHSEVQEKIYNEIENIIGKHRFPSLTDKSRMPYIEAVILETMRVSSVVSLGIFHCCLEDYHFHEFFIPKDTLVISNLHGIHHDPIIWGDPQNFRPERFLSLDGKNVLKHEALMPFSTGKRVCPGEALAKDELFLIGTTIIQKFKISRDPLCPMLTMKQKVTGVVSTPKPHRLVFYER